MISFIVVQGLFLLRPPYCFRLCTDLGWRRGSFGSVPNISLHRDFMVGRQAG